MFERTGRGELLDRRAALGPGDGPARAIFGRCDVEARILRLAVEHDMFAAVHRFLIEEIVDLAAPRLRRAFAIMAHRFHKEFLADRDGRGQHVEECGARSEEHTSELQSLMRITYTVYCLKKKKSDT